MKKKLLLTLLLTVAFAATSSAQVQEQTAAPGIIENPCGFYEHHVSSGDGSLFYVDIFNEVTFVNNDEAEATIYCRINSDDENAWFEYNGETFFALNNEIEAYAVAEGKLPSDIVCHSVYYHTYLDHVAYVIDGIHYYVQVINNALGWDPSSEACVCSRKESCLYSPPYQENIVIPSVITIEETYTSTVTWIRNAAFASSIGHSSDIVSVELPNTISLIGPSAFAGCTHLKRITLHSLTPPETGELFAYEYGDEDSGYYDYIGFDGNQLYDQVSLFVPNDALEDYCNHYEWGKFSRIVPFIGAGPGDVNGDGELGINDVTELINQLLNGVDLPAYDDVNGDGNITIGDITALIDMLLNGN